MRLCKNFIEIFLIISTFGLSKEFNIDLSSSSSSTAPSSLSKLSSSLLIERQKQQEQQQLKGVDNIKEQLQQKLQQHNNLSNNIISSTPPTIITSFSETTTTTLVDDTETDVNDLFVVVNETRDSRSLHRQFFINNQQEANVIRPKDYSYNNKNMLCNNKLNDYSIDDSINDTNIDNIKNVGRFLSTPDDCITKSGNTGLCMRRFECIKNGGSASGFCGTFGVCCELNFQCGGVSKLKRTIIKNPQKIPNECTYHFQWYNSNVCQLRIDFDIILDQPTLPNSTNGIQSVSCLMDEFRVGNIVICGRNMKQHIYLPFDTKNKITDMAITFKLADRLHNRALLNPFWNMIVTQLECPPSKSTYSSNGMLSYFTQQYTNLPDLETLFLKPNYYTDVDLLAPPGCLQYFTERQGTFESFNFNMGKGPYMSNMRYGICFKRTFLDSQIRFSATTFQIGAATDMNYFLDTDCHDIVGTPKRPNDYLAILESVLEASIPLYANYYCGTSLNVSVIHAPPGPFAIYFNSDDTYSTLVPEIGFKINYIIQ